MKGGAWRWTLVVAYAGLIFYLSHQPQWVIALPEIWGTDKLLHLFEYAVLTVLILFGLGDRAWEGRWIVAAGLVAVTYGILDEVHQSFVPGRVADPLDAAADAVGVLLTLVVHFAWSRARARTG